MNISRPATGWGWVLALIVLIVAVISLIVSVNVAHFDTFLIIGLALALVLG